MSALQGTPLRRRKAIERLLRSRTVASQEALRALLEREGFLVTQATLSRDLARLGARRGRGPRGEVVYELGEPNGVAPGNGAPGDALDLVRTMVLTVEDNGDLVVIHTVPGGAPAVARAIDLSRPEAVLGTLAGDDTVFVAPRRSGGAGELRRLLAAGLLRQGAGPDLPRSKRRRRMSRRAAQPRAGQR